MAGTSRGILKICFLSLFSFSLLISLSLSFYLLSEAVGFILHLGGHGNCTKEEERLERSDWMMKPLSSWGLGDVTCIDCIGWHGITKVQWKGYSTRKMNFVTCKNLLF